jgi:cytochrome P450
MSEQAARALSQVLSQDGTIDPYPLYDQMRESAPIFKSDLGLWVVTTYDDCRTVLRDARMGKDWAGFMVTSGHENWRDQPAFEYGENSLLFANPPDHTRLRRLVSKAFTPRQVERLRANMRLSIATLLEPFARDGGGDLLDALAFPLPVGVVGNLLGVPEADWQAFREPVRAGTATLELGVTQEQIKIANKSSKWMRDYFVALVAEKRANPDDGMISGMLAVEDQGDRLDDDEIVGMAALLFAAGFETTTNLIGNGVNALLHNPDELEKLRRQPSLIEGATEELLRYDSSIQFSGRTAFERLELGGFTVEAGENVMTFLGAANRDPAHYEDPHRLDVTRTDVEPLSFGNGIHFCLGASLARTEAQEAIGALLAKFDTIELAEEPRYRAQFGFRGLESLQVRCRA